MDSGQQWGKNVVLFAEAIEKKQVKISFLPWTIEVVYKDKNKLKISKLNFGIDVNGQTWTIDGQKQIIPYKKSYSDKMWSRGDRRRES